jgi:hypothetical protein
MRLPFLCDLLCGLMELHTTFIMSIVQPAPTNTRFYAMEYIPSVPISGKTPEISKSNHTYVELLMLQSKDDLIHFGKIGLFNISRHFPQMKHRDSITGRMATIMPWPLGGTKPLSGQGSILTLQS